MAIEIVSFPIKNGDFPVRNVSLPEGKAILPYSSPYWNSKDVVQDQSSAASVSAELFTAKSWRGEFEFSIPNHVTLGKACGAVFAETLGNPLVILW